MRVVGLQPRGVHDENSVGGGVRLVEGVFGELEHVVPDLLCNLARITVAHRTVEPVLLHGFGVAVGPGLLNFAHEGDFLLRHGLAHLVALAHGKAAHLHGNLHDLLLVDHGAIGVFEDAAQAVVIESDGTTALLALHEVVDHAGAQGAGAEERDGCHDVGIAVRLHAFEQRGHAVGFNLEHAGGVAAGEQLIDFGVHEVNVAVDVHLAPVVRADVRDGFGDERHGAQAQEVHLQQAHVGGHRAVVLGDHHAALGVQLGGHVVPNWVSADDDGRGVHTLAAGQVLKRLGRVDDLLHVRVFRIGLAQVGVFVQCALQGHLRVVGDHLGNLVGEVNRVVEHAGGVLHGSLRLHLGVGDDVRDLVVAIQVADVLDHLQPPLVVEVHVDIGHFRSLGA